MVSRNIKLFKSSEHTTSTQNVRVSFYLCEMIFFNVYLKLTLPASENSKEGCSEKEKGIRLLHKYLQSSTVVSSLELNDLCLLWLCVIHLEAFGCMPSWLRTPSLFSNRISPYLNLGEFWNLNVVNETCTSSPSLSNKRNFNHIFFKSINLVYKLRVDNFRSFDIFILPWNSKGPASIKCDAEKLKNLFHEAFKSMNNSSCLFSKRKIYQFSLPLFINLIILEVANKRYEVANKLCQRLLKSSDTEIFKELWLSLIYIQQCQLHQSSFSNLPGSNAANELVNLENTFMSCLKMFPVDTQIVFLSSKFYTSIVKINLNFILNLLT